MNSIATPPTQKPRIDRGGKSHHKNVVVLVRLCGNVMAVVRNGEGIRVRKIGVYVTKPPSQADVLELLRAR